MSDTPFGSWLARAGERLISATDLRAAVARQAVYGGTLDTALLEAGALGETALWARLSAATGLPVPAPALCDGTGTHPTPLLAAGKTGALGAVPVAVDATAATMKILCRESAPVEAIRAQAAEQGFEARLYVVPEVRLLAMRQRVYGERLPARYASLLARLLGPTRARADFLPRPVVAEAHELGGAEPMTLMPDPTSGPVRLANLYALSPSGPAASLPDAGALDVAAAPSGTDGGAERAAAPLEAVPESVTAGDSTGAATEALCRRARDRDDKGRLLAARALRRRLGQPVVAQLMEVLRAEAADTDGAADVVTSAIETLAEARDPAAVPVLVERLGKGPQAVTAAAQAALSALCATELGPSRRRWAAWARKHLGRPRVEWLLEGLGHKQPEIRMAAAEELRQLSGDSFGYLFDLPKRERESARKRYVAWWEGIAALATPSK